MRVLVLVVAVSVATMMWTVGCGPKKEDLPQVEPAPAMEKGPASVEPAPIEQAPVARPKPTPGMVEAAPLPAPGGSQTYTVKKGDTLYSLAKRYYGDGKLWPRIFDANRDKLKDASVVPVGTVLVIPPK